MQAQAAQWQSWLDEAEAQVSIPSFQKNTVEQNFHRAKQMTLQIDSLSKQGHSQQLFISMARFAYFYLHVLKPIQVQDKFANSKKLYREYAITCMDKLEKMKKALVLPSSALKKVTVPQSILHSFLQYAGPNLKRNVEFCGILCGTQNEFGFVITTILIPKQDGDSDSCYAMNEEELAMYQTKHDLLTLGWIHTHPTQQAFLSTVDLATHYSYQVLLPEAIAIVCAPQHQPSYGVFRMTDNGMNVVASKFKQDSKFGTLHEYLGESLFETCQHFVTSNSALNVVDLR